MTKPWIVGSKHGGRQQQDPRARLWLQTANCDIVLSELNLHILQRYVYFFDLSQKVENLGFDSSFLLIGALSRREKRSFPVLESGLRQYTKFPL